MKEFESARLIASQLVLDDADEIRVLFNQIEAKRYLLNVEFDRRKTEEFIRWCQIIYNRHKLSPFVFRSKTNRQLVGLCGPTVETVNGVEEFNFGYIIDQSLWGNGYASEAAQSVVKYAFTHRLCNSLVAVIQPEHEVSLKVCLRLGFQSHLETEFHGKRAKLYKLSYDDWKLKN